MYRGFPKLLLSMCHSPLQGPHCKTKGMPTLFPSLFNLSPPLSLIYTLSLSLFPTSPLTQVTHKPTKQQKCLVIVVLSRTAGQGCLQLRVGLLHPQPQKHPLQQFCSNTQGSPGYKADTPIQHTHRDKHKLTRCRQRRAQR